MSSPILSIKIIGLSEAESLIGRLPTLFKAVLTDSYTLAGIGTVLLKSAITTLDQGGRPLYKPLAQSTINQRWHKEQKRTPGNRANRQGIVSNQPLKKTGILRESLTYTVSGNSLTLNSIGYLKYHQFEADRIKARFPARPVWGIHDEDRADIADIITEQLSNAITSYTRA